MKIEKIMTPLHPVASVFSRETILWDTQSALDLIMTAKYETGCDRIVVNKQAVSEDFFVLSTGLAGEVLQKFINYQVLFAIYGDFSKYTSKPLKDFIRESNRGKDVFFVRDQEEAVERLGGCGQ